MRQSESAAGSGMRFGWTNLISGPSVERALHHMSHSRLVDSVAGVIEEAILAGRLRPGDHLIEHRIGAELEVSRATVRDALRILERQGLVVSEPRRGAFVTRLSAADAADLCRVRGLIEGYAVSAGFPFAADVVAMLKGIIAEMATCVLPGELPRLLSLDLAFHRVLVEAARSPRLREWWESLNGQVRALYLTSLEERAEDITGVIAMHQELLDGLEGTDSHRAAQLAVAHYVGPRGIGEHVDTHVSTIVP